MTTHMQALGCFGSSLAFAPETDVCRGCDDIKACEAEVTSRRPQLLKTCSQFSDIKGETMAFHWLTSAEKKALRARRKLGAQQQAAIVTYGDPAGDVALRACMTGRAHKFLDDCTAARLNPTTCSLDQLSALSQNMGVVIKALLSGQQTVAVLTAALLSERRCKPYTAKLDTLAIISFLTCCDRAVRVGPKSVELK